MSSDWVVHKFGGTSVAGAERYRHVAGVMAREPGAKKAIVVSAMSGVTDALHALVDLAKKRDDAYHAKLRELRARHVDTARALLPAAEADRIAGVLDEDTNDVADVLRAIWLGKSCSELTLELIAGYGELWSAQIFCAHLRALGVRAEWLDARLAPRLGFSSQRWSDEGLESWARCRADAVTGHDLPMMTRRG